VNDGLPHPHQTRRGKMKLYRIKYKDGRVTEWTPHKRAVELYLFNNPGSPFEVTGKIEKKESKEPTNAT
jgi:hypothetical protein